jgi:hypothetical protein
MNISANPCRRECTAATLQLLLSKREEKRKLKVRAVMSNLLEGLTKFLSMWFDGPVIALRKNCTQSKSLHNKPSYARSHARSSVSQTLRPNFTEKGSQTLNADIWSQCFATYNQ